MLAAANRSAVSVCCVSTVVALFLSACGGNSGSPTAPGGTTPPGSGRTVTTVVIEGTVSLQEGKTTQLRARATYSDGTAEDVSSRATWKSSNAQVASVSGTGLVTALASGTSDISAEFQGQSGRRTLQISRARMTITVRMQSITALDTCDDVFQGLERGEFGYRVRLVATGGAAAVVDQDPADYPGNPNSLRPVTLARNGRVALSSPPNVWHLPTEDGQFVRVEFNATEWDSEYVFPVSSRWIHDSRLDDRAVTRTHGFTNGAFSNLGSNTLTAGGASCGLRLEYTVSATPE